MSEPVFNGIHLPLTSGEEFTKLPWRSEGFVHLYLVIETVFQIKHVLQVSIAGFPCNVQLALRSFFLGKDTVKKHDRTVKALLSLIST